MFPKLGLLFPGLTSLLRVTGRIQNLKEKFIKKIKFSRRRQIFSMIFGFHWIFIRSLSDFHYIISLSKVSLKSL